jgi:hypothetical protein
MALLSGVHFAAILVPFFAATDNNPGRIKRKLQTAIRNDYLFCVRADDRRNEWSGRLRGRYRD